jgi:hypothetical protein
MTRNCILTFLGLHHLLAGELATAERLIDEGRLIADATGNLPVTYAAMLLTAWQSRVHEASELIQAAVQMATGSGRACWPASRRTRARCWTTVWACMTPGGTPRSRPLSATIWDSPGGGAGRRDGQDR